MHLNHYHLCVPDVAAASDFFVQYFDFRLREVRGRSGFAVLDGDSGVVLALMKTRPDAAPPSGFLDQFHIGFLVGDEATVHAVHGRLAAGGHGPSGIEFMRGSHRFYCRAPGGLLVEVGHEPAA